MIYANYSDFVKVFAPQRLFADRRRAPVNTLGSGLSRRRDAGHDVGYNEPPVAPCRRAAHD